MRWWVARHSSNTRKRVSVKGERLSERRRRRERLKWTICLFNYNCNYVNCVIIDCAIETCHKATRRGKTRAVQKTVCPLQCYLSLSNAYGGWWCCPCRRGKVMRSGGLYGIYFIIIILCPGQRQLAREVHNSRGKWFTMFLLLFTYVYRGWRATWSSTIGLVLQSRFSSVMLLQSNIIGVYSIHCGHSYIAT